MKLTHEELIKKGYKVVWEDHFDAPDVDEKIWNKYDTQDEKGHHDRTIWRNPNNIFTKDSCLVIKGTIDEDENGNKRYNCGLIKSEKFAFRYGYAEARAKIAVAGDGIWMGYWMCGSNGKVVSEIDIAEMFGDDSVIASNIHAWWRDRNYGNKHRFNFLDLNSYPKTKKLPDGKRFSDDFHNFGYYWTPEFVEFMLDGECYCHIDITNPMFTLCHNPLNFIFSMLYGSTFVPQPDEDRTEPIEFCIDYIRLYQDDKGELFDLDAEGIHKRQ